ncbi:MAG: hypothetical protein R3C11_08175 [Planctomycetaceae bacterium]
MKKDSFQAGQSKGQAENQQPQATEDAPVSNNRSRMAQQSRSIDNTNKLLQKQMEQSAPAISGRKRPRFGLSEKEEKVLSNSNEVSGITIDPQQSNGQQPSTKADGTLFQQQPVLELPHRTTGLQLERSLDYQNLDNLILMVMEQWD